MGDPEAREVRDVHPAEGKRVTTLLSLGDTGPHQRLGMSPEERHVAGYGQFSVDSLE
ncbi:MAG: hypothetical protein P1T08_08090 [Acidimicrobiia bacterium]|nr:hypothetical protein [Acidimicrobiia bacterium]